jgi:HEAT repeats
MRGNQFQHQGVISVLLTILSGITLPFIVTNIKTFAQTPSTQVQCSEVRIKSYIQKLSNSEQLVYDALLACKDKAIFELIQALKSQNKQVRIMVITALGEIGSPDAVLPLSDLLANETRRDVRVSVIFALSNFGKQGVPTLITALKDRDWYIRYQAANALNEIGSDAKDAIYALNEIGFYAKDVIPALNNAVKDENVNVHSAATRALAGIKKELEQREQLDTLIKISRVEPTIVNVPPKQNVVTFAMDISPERGSSSRGRNLRLPSSIRNVESAISPRYRRIPTTVGRETVGEITKSSKLPLMCRVPALRNIFKWKCG